MDDAFRACREKTRHLHRGEQLAQSDMWHVLIDKLHSGSLFGWHVGFKDAASDREQALMSALGQQPVSSATEADQSSFQLYNRCVITASCGASFDHGVLAVGYGTDAGSDCWKMKHSPELSVSSSP